MYSTVSDIRGLVDENTMIFLTDDGNGEVDEGKIQGAIVDADSEINAYLQKKYTVPLTPTPPVLNKLSKDIVLYNLFSRRGVNEESVEKTVIDRYKNAVKLLENIAKGVVELGISAPKPTSEIKITSNKRLFSRRSLEGM